METGRAAFRSKYGAYYSDVVFKVLVVDTHLELTRFCMASHNSDWKAVTLFWDTSEKSALSYYYCCL